MLEPREQLEAARKLIGDNLAEVADELREWGDTALLRDGKLRQAARLLSHETFKYQALRTVEGMAYKLMAQRLSDLYREGQH